MTYTWEDILIVGDSFCADRNDQNDWPNIFTSAITRSSSGTKQIRGAGFPGASWWSARKKLLEELKNTPVKILVACHTEPYRIPNDDNLGLNTRSVGHNIIYVPSGIATPTENFVKAAKNYYEYIISEEYHIWAYRQWFKEIDEIAQNYNIEKVVHFFCFQGPYNDHTFTNGVTMEIPLVQYQTSPLWKKNKTRNHFSIAHNLELGLNLANIIKNFPGNGVRLNTKLIGK